MMESVSLQAREEWANPQLLSNWLWLSKEWIWGSASWTSTCADPQFPKCLEKTSTKFINVNKDGCQSTQTPVRYVQIFSILHYKYLHIVPKAKGTTHKNLAPFSGMVCHAFTHDQPFFHFVRQTLGLMSIGFLLSSDDEAVVWRGPKKNAMIKQVSTTNTWTYIIHFII